ncbi:hypothetical protein L7F22_004488 [Adiantum nelumboides]|nr:hypothetical protein [Adiantum nelumboides]
MAMQARQDWGTSMFELQPHKGAKKGKAIHIDLRGGKHESLDLETSVNEFSSSNYSTSKEKSIVTDNSDNPQAEIMGVVLINPTMRAIVKDAEAALLKTEDIVDAMDALKVEELKSTIKRLLLTLQTLQVVVEEKAPLDAMNSALKERDATQEVEECAQAKPFTKMEFAGGNKCEEQNSKVLVHAAKEDVLDKEAEPNAEVKIVRGYNCEEHDPKVEVHVEKEGVLEKDSLENGDQAKNCPLSMKDNEVSARDTIPSILQTIQMMQRERKRKMTDAATRNIDNLDHIICMMAKSTPPDVDTSFRVEGQVPCASNIKDQEDKNTEFFALSTGEDTTIIIKKSKPPQEKGDASVDVGGDASGAVNAVDAGGAVGVGSAGEVTNIIIEKSKPPQEDGDAFVDASGDASYAGGAVGVGGAGEDMKIIIEKFEPP